MVTCSTAVFSSRHPGYRLGVIGLFLSSLAFLVGNWAPEWVEYSRTERNVAIPNGTIHYRRTRDHSSVLFGCHHLFENGTKWAFFFRYSFEDTEDNCGNGYSVSSASGAWVRAAQAFESMGALALLFACICTLYSNFCRSAPGPRKRFVEVVTVSAGVCGFVGTMIFVGSLRGLVSGGDYYSFCWALPFTIVVSIVVVVVGVVIAVFNRSAADDYMRLN